VTRLLKTGPTPKQVKRCIVKITGETSSYQKPVPFPKSRVLGDIKIGTNQIGAFLSIYKMYIVDIPPYYGGSISPETLGWGTTNPVKKGNSVQNNSRIG
jgi:hypothetical protein